MSFSSNSAIFLQSSEVSDFPVALFFLSLGFFLYRKRQKDFSIIVINGEQGFGNKRVIPSGPLRESISRGIERANLIIVIGEIENDVKRKIPNTIPLIHAKFKISKENKIKHLIFASTSSVYGENKAFFIKPVSTPESMFNGSPLNWDHDSTAVNVYCIEGTTNGSKNFNLIDWEKGSGGYWENWYIVNGVFYSKASD